MNKVIVLSPIFRGLTENDVVHLLNETPHTIRSFSKGQTIAQRTKEVRNLCIVVKGSVKG